MSTHGKNIDFLQTLADRLLSTNNPDKNNQNAQFASLQKFLMIYREEAEKAENNIRIFERDNVVSHVKTYFSKKKINVNLIKQNESGKLVERLVPLYFVDPLLNL